MCPSRSLLILLIVLLPAGPFATTFPVTKTADTNDGTCDPDCSLREAIDAANTNPGSDDVPVPAGFYLLTLGQLTVTDDVSIAGAGQTTTIIDGNATDRVFQIEATSGVVAISGVTIQNGKLPIQYSCPCGGGIRNYAALHLTDSTVRDNTGLFSVSFHSVGGGIWSSGDMTLTNRTVSDNTAMSSGGIWSSGDMTLTNSTVSDNTATWSGGGISIRYGDLTLTNSTVSGNTAVGGDGIMFYIYASSSNDVATLSNSTLSGNVGGAIDSAKLCGISCVGNVSVYVANSIFADNGTGGCGITQSLGYNLSDDESCNLYEPTDLIVADAMLGPLQDNGGPTETHDLLPGSPAIDAGSMDCPPPDTDQRGVARPQGAGCDIGAVEYLPEARGALVLIAGAGFLGLLYWRRVRGLRRASRC